jgi:hypothetical protein
VEPSAIITSVPAAKLFPVAHDNEPFSSGGDLVVL